ncbi:MAG: hypothetical protein ACI8SJ_000420 [Shewanella sp.]|jgi:hypothetical protein
MMQITPAELNTLTALIESFPQLRAKSLTEVTYKKVRYPVIAVELGSEDTDKPCVLFVGGVHGVERIGTQVILALLESLLVRLEWDSQLQHLLTEIRVAFVPIVNPIGLLNGTRCNGQHVDLMRNAPLDATTKVTFLVGGQRVSSLLPWYRGKNGMEQETLALIRYVESLQSNASSVISLDAHSGFGMSDHIWFPFASSQQPIKSLGQIYHLKQLYQASFPHHSHYQFSPQSLIYRTHGDIWDYLATKQHDTLLLPLTLEMGSWAWVKKNPRQIFNFAGLFNPQKQHRHVRTLRKHTVLMQFLMDLAASRVIEDMSSELITRQYDAAMQYWYQHNE